MSVRLDPTFDPKPLEPTEVDLVRRDEHQVIDARDGRDLPVDERRRFPGRLESYPLASMPFGRSAVVVQDRKARHHDILQETFDRISATRNRKARASELQFVPNDRGDGRFSLVAGKSTKDGTRRTGPKRFRNDVRIE